MLTSTYDDPFLPHARITDLGFGGGFALWGTRAIAGGHGNCRQLSAGFNQAFALDNQMDHPERHCRGGANGRLAINALKSFVSQLGRAGQRTIRLSSSGTMRITADEVCMVAALSAAQGEDIERCRSHLCWLLGRTDSRLTYQAALTYGQICSHVGMTITRPSLPDMTCTHGKSEHVVAANDKARGGSPHPRPDLCVVS